MKLKIAGTISILIITASCMVQKKTKKPDFAWVFPQEMQPHVKEAYIEMWKKGEILYDVSCSRCHNQVVGRKVIVPEFTQEQMATYEVRVSDPQHEMFLTESKVTPEELSLINIYLTYREHDTVALNKLLAAPRDHNHDM